MKTKAIRLHGVNDIRLEEFDLPEITEDEVLIRVVSDSVCASTYKAIKQGTAHKLPSGYDPGYSNPYIGGNTQYAVVPKIVLERGCLLPYDGDSYLAGSLAEALGADVIETTGSIKPNGEIL